MAGDLLAGAGHGTRMDAPWTPVLDNHLHLHPDGEGVAAAETFARAGGTHLLVVNRPSWHLVDDVADAGAFRETFERTVELVEGASSVLPGRAWAVLGVHPVLLPRLVSEGAWSVAEAAALVRAGLDLAAAFVDEGRALALKSGRPHFPVDDAVRDASNEAIRHACTLAADAGCAVQLHTEDSEDLTDVAALAEDAGLDPARVVKHYASGPVAGVTPSVIARPDPIRAAREAAGPFLMETDFLDDPARPGAVLGPKTVPRRCRELAAAGHTEALERAHVETPARVYGIDTRGTLG